MQESASSHEFSRIFFPPLHKPHLTTLLSIRNQTPSIKLRYICDNLFAQINK